MSFFNKMKSSVAAAAKTTAAVATKAANVTADLAKEAYTTAVARPTAIRCEQEDCKEKLQVPPDIWKWDCGCGTNNSDEAKECVECKTARPKAANPTVTCGVCGTVCVVYSSVTAQTAAETARATKKGAQDAAKWTQNKFVELKSRPTTVQCKMEACKLLLAVPAEVWEWTCENGHACKADDKTCPTCQAKRPSFTPVLTCQCGAQVLVPSTGAKAQLDQGVAATKEQTKAAVVAAKASYSHYTSAPEEFNCQHCNEKLHVPPPVFWHCVSCGQQNPPDIAKCSECNTKNTQEVMCGNCNQVCSVPDTNLANAARTTKLSAKKGFKDLTASAKNLTTAESKQGGEEMKDAGAPAPLPATADATPPAGAAP